MRPHIFISRPQTPDSPFTQLIGERAVVVGRSLVAFEGVMPPSIPKGDWLFFYSKKGLQYGLPYWLDRPQLPPIGVMGKGSAQYLKTAFGLDANFIGKGTPAEIAQAFGTLAKGQRVVFVQAAHSRQSVQQQLTDHLEALSVVVYQNRLAPVDDLPFCQLLVFTSPMNVAAYFHNHSPHPEQQFISIGQTTAAALHAQGLTNVHIAAEPTEPALAKACLKVLSQLG